MILSKDKLKAERTLKRKFNENKDGTTVYHERSSFMPMEEPERKRQIRESENNTTVHEAGSSSTAMDEDGRNIELLPGIADDVTMEEDCIMEPLFPGIPNDVTLHHICTKLDWSDLLTLSSLSPDWQIAMESHQVHEARVQSNATNKVVVLNYTIADHMYGLALYCLKSRACDLLPPIPQVNSGIPQSCECITLDGRIYILGGLEQPSTQLSSADVYMLDVAGQTDWKKCASMKSPRQSFACGVMNGKIYACGGFSGLEPVSGTEMYDPELDVWTELTPMPSRWTGTAIGIVGDELLVYGGSSFHQRRFVHQRLDSGRDSLANHAPGWIQGANHANHFEVYNPTRNEWRRPLQHPEMQDSIDRRKISMFVMEGKLHFMTRSHIFHLDLERHFLTCVNSIEPRKLALGGSYTPHRVPAALLAVDDQLLALDKWYVYYHGTRQPSQPRGYVPLSLIQSKGPSIHNKRIVWERVLAFFFEGLISPFLRSLEL